MKRRSVIKSLQIAGSLTTCFYAGFAHADWSQKHPYGGFNQGYGDFPPADIDQQLSGTGDENATVQSQSPPVQNTTESVNQQPVPANTAQNTTRQTPQQAVQQPVYGGYYQNYQMPPGAQPYNRGTNFNGPWNNNRSNFSGPWNNRGSSFSGPWNNRGSSFGGPWNGGNNGPSFSGPWNNNGSNFSAPWNNNRSGFSPWGNGGGWSW